MGLFATLSINDIQHNNTAIMLSVVILSVRLLQCCAEYHYAECHYAECRGAVKNTLAYHRETVITAGKSL